MTQKILLSVLFFFSLNAVQYSQSITVLSPNGGETYYVFNQIYIAWESTEIDYINIEYSTDSGQSWMEVINFYPVDLEFYFGFAPNTASDSCLVKILDYFNPLVNDLSDSLFSTIIYQMYDFISINEIKMWIGNNGDGSHDPRTDGNGFYWPGGENATLTAVFEDGLVWGGIIDGQIRVNGNTHRQGLRPGTILPNGQPDDPMDPRNKIFKTRKNWEYLPPGILRDRLEYDFFNWPWDIGAPWVDVDGDDIYTPGIDTPDYIGDEVLFYTANDLDSATTAFTYGSPPIGLEFKTITYGFHKEDELKDAVFKKYILINKSTNIIDSLYISYWSDSDLGDASDDVVGCDISQNLGYTYNGDEDDGGYYIPPAAVGHMLIQGPKIPGNPGDSAYYNGGWISGYKNMQMTSFTPNFKNTTNGLPRDPIQGQYQGTLEMYNLMKGFNNWGDSLINPHTGNGTIFSLAGNPVNGTGWYEGEGWSGGPNPGDRRIHVNTGPFTMTPGDTQEVVIAIFMAQGTDRLNSVQLLKDKAQIIQNFYYGDTLTSIQNYYSGIPLIYKLQQNYPNPFNPTTTIEFSIPKKEFVELRVFDILGREVTTLINTEQLPGYHKIKFDGSNLASGVYIYRLHSGDFKESKKLLLLK